MKKKIEIRERFYDRKFGDISEGIHEVIVDRIAGEIPRENYGKTSIGINKSYEKFS